MTLLGFAIGYNLGLILAVVLYNFHLKREKQERNEYMRKAISEYCNKKGGEYLKIKEVLENV
jgi:hypothetical protein